MGMPAWHIGHSATAIVLGRPVLGQREVRHAEIDHRFEPIVDLDVAITVPPASSMTAFARSNVFPVLRTSSASSTRLPATTDR